MRKLFAWGLPEEEEAAPETRTFTDPRHPGEAFALCLARPGLLEEAAISEVAETYCAEYLAVGAATADAKRGVEARAARPFLAPSGKRYPLNRAAIWEVSAVYCLQGGPAADRYAWTDLLGIYLKRGRLWRPASAWAGALLEEARESLGEEPPAEEPPAEAAEPEASEASSSAPLPTTTSKTPKPSPGKTGSSAPSPIASAA
jgi:hypothetical protein